MDVLRSNQHNGFPVTHFNADGEAYIMGVVLRQHLLVVLASRRACQPSPFVTEVGTEGERGVQGSGGEGAVGQHQPPTFHTAIKPPIRPCGPVCCQGSWAYYQREPGNQTTAVLWHGSSMAAALWHGSSMAVALWHGGKNPQPHRGLF